MSKYSNLELFQMSTMDEKRVVVSEFFRAYKSLEEYDIAGCRRNISDATSLWGAREIEANFVQMLDSGELKKLKQDLFDISIYLLGLLSPSKNIQKEPPEFD